MVVLCAMQAASAPPVVVSQKLTTLQGEGCAGQETIKASKEVSVSVAVAVAVRVMRESSTFFPDLHGVTDY